MKCLAGSRQGDVISLLKARAGALERGKGWDDGRKLGLVVEGGGMRGVLSAGSLLAVDLMGFRDCFDAVYSVSAGSVNAAYFLSGQGAEGITVYFDDISGPRFINPWRLWKVADVDFVYDYVVRELKPLNEYAVRASRPEFYVTVTDIDDGTTQLLNAKDPRGSVATYLKASSALPVLYNRSVTISGHHYMDGGVGAGLPIPSAIEQGCTDILVLVSRPLDYVSFPPRPLERFLFFVSTGALHPQLYRSWRMGSETKEHARKLALGTVTAKGVHIATIAPDRSANDVSRMTRTRDILFKGAYQSALKTVSIFDRSSEIVERAFSLLR